MSIISRSEACQWIESLEVGSSLFMEAQDALIRGVGIRTLSNGLKINTTPLSALLLGGALSRADADRAFGAAVQHLNALAPLKGGDAAVALCQKARGEVATLIAYTEGEIKSTETGIAQMEKSASDGDKQVTALAKQERDTQAKIAELEEKKSGLQSKLGDLKKRQDAEMRLSAMLDGSFRVAVQMFEEMQKQIRAVDASLGAVQERQRALHKEKEALIKKRTQADERIKAAVDRLTQLKNGLKNLKTLLGKYRILSTDIDLAKLRAELGLLKESTVKAMVTELTGTQKMLLP